MSATLLDDATRQRASSKTRKPPDAVKQASPRGAGAQFQQQQRQASPGGKRVASSGSPFRSALATSPGHSVQGGSSHLPGPSTRSTPARQASGGRGVGHPVTRERPTESRVQPVPLRTERRVTGAQGSPVGATGGRPSAASTGRLCQRSAAASTGGRPSVASTGRVAPAARTSAPGSLRPGSPLGLDQSAYRAGSGAASGVGVAPSVSSANTPLLSNLFEGEQFAQLMHASPSSQQRLSELLEEVNREIQKILVSGGDSSELAASIKALDNEVPREEESIGSSTARSVVRSRSNGRTEASQSLQERRRVRPGRLDNQLGSQSSNTGRASLIVKRLCRRVDSLQSSLKVLDSKRRIGSSPLDMSPGRGVQLSTARPPSRNAPDGAREDGDVEGLSRLEDMLTRLESQVRASFPSGEDEEVSRSLPPTDSVAGSHQQLSVQVGELEQKKLTLEEEITLLMRQKEEITSRVGSVCVGAATGAVWQAAAQPPLLVVGSGTNHVVDGLSGSRRHVSPDRVIYKASSQPGIEAPSVAAHLGSTSILAAAPRPQSPPAVTVAAPSGRPAVPPVPLAAFNNVGVPGAASMLSDRQPPAHPAAFSNAPVSPNSGACRGGSTPTAPHMSPSRAATPQAHHSSGTPPCSPRSVCVYPTLRPAFSSHPALTLSARRLHMQPGSAGYPGEVGPPAIPTVIGQALLQ